MPQEDAQPAATKTAAPSLKARTAAMEAIRKAGGNIFPDFEKLQATGLGEDVWNPRNEFIYAGFARGENVDDALANLAQFPELQTVNLIGTRVTEAGLAHVGRLKNVVALTLDSTPTTDVGLSRLVGLKKLRILDLSKTKVTSRGMQWLAHLENLESLSLNDTAVGDEGLKSLGALERLKSITLKNTRVTDAGLALLANVAVKDADLTDFDVFLAPPLANPNVQRVLKALDDKTEMEFQDQPLSDVVEYLRERHNINIQLHTKSIVAAGHGSNSPITMKVRGIPLREAMNQMLEKYDLAMAVRHEVLMIYGKPLPRQAPSIPILPAGERLSPKLRDALDDKTELEFVDQPLVDVVAYLSERHNIKIVLDNAAMIKAGVGSDAPVTLNIKGIMLKSGLELVLGEMGLTCFAEGDRLVVRPIP